MRREGEGVGEEGRSRGGVRREGVGVGEEGMRRGG